MSETALFISIGSAVVVLIIITIMKASGRGKNLEVFRMEKGFLPCAEAEGSLLEKVISLERNAEYTYRLEEAFKARLKGETLYCYTKHRTRHNEDPHVVLEFLIPFNRRSAEPLTVYLKPTAVGDGLAATLLKSVTGISWDAQPDDLVKADPLAALGTSNVLNAFCKEGHALLDLMDGEQWKVIDKAGDSGMVQLRFNEDFCSFEYMPHCPGVSLNGFWSMIEKMMAASLDPALCGHERETLPI